LDLGIYQWIKTNQRFKSQFSSTWRNYSSRIYIKQH